MFHTKGNWKWEQTRGNNYYEHTVFVDSRLGVEIAALSGEGCSPEEVKANARLIAVAPELLAACQNYREWWANHFGDFNSEINDQLLCLDNDAEAAIEAAKGD